MRCTNKHQLFTTVPQAHTLPYQAERESQSGFPESSVFQTSGSRTKQILELVPETKLVTIERCSGHDGTYAVKLETHDASMKIVRPIVKRIQAVAPDHYGSDCPIAATQLWNGLGGDIPPRHPINLLRIAYGI